jgi:uncharacterized protein (TIGR03000 family)
MLRKIFSFGGLLLFAGAAILATPGSGWAQHHGGGHFGGGHFGGGHFGGAHFGGGHFGGGHFGGAHFGGAHFGGAHFGGALFGHRFGYPHAYYRPYHGYYPYYGLSSYYPYYDTYGYVGSGPTYGGGYYGSGGDEAPSYPDDYTSVTPPAASYQSFYPSATAQPDNRAFITANVPADAQLWFDGKATTSTGPVREFHSPSLTPGQWFTYEVRASWNDNGHEVTQTQQVEVTAGAHINVDFPLPPKATGQPSAVK